MKLILSLLTAFFLFFQSSDLEALRTSYAKANSSKESTQSFIDLAEKKTSSDPVITGYRAAAKIMEAKIVTKNRKSLVSEGAVSLENTIKNNPNNIELRVIRLSIQENLPKIVGYRFGLKDDKNFILSNYGKQNAALKSYIKRFVKQSKTMSDAEKASLK